MDFLLTIVVAIVGGKIAIRLKIPAGAMIGAMVSVSAFNLSFGIATMPAEYKILTQIATGAFIGARIKKEDILGLKEVLKPAIIIVSCMGVMNFILGYILYKNSSLDLTTALFSTAPGGMMDMSLIAHELNADSAKVVIFQLVRLISVIGVIPIFLKKIIRKNLTVESSIKNEKESKKDEKNNLINISLTVIVGILAGYIGYLSKIPAGALSFSMVGVGIFNIFFNRGYMPIPLRQLIQMFGGALIGIKVSVKDVLEMSQLLHLVIVVIIGFLIMNIVIGMIVYRVSNFDIATSLFSAAPGGVSDISIIASEMGADTPKVAIIQLMRLVSIVSLYPILIQIIVKFID